MPKKKAVRTKTGRRGASAHRRLRLTKPVAAAVVACLIAAAAAATRWEPVRRAVGLAPLAGPAAPPQSGATPAKEYVYAGGRLVATEEPPPLGGPAPTGLVATAASATSVGLTWTAPSSGAVTGYVVERRHGPAAPPVEIQTGGSTPGFTDTTASADTAYLYRVRAVFADGGTSGFSNGDLATTVVFTDASLQGVAIKAVHLNEARRAVNAVRALAGFGPASWTYLDPVSAPPESRRAIYLEDMIELRTNLNPALAALGSAQLPNDPTLDRQLPVRGAHVQDVRDKVR